MTDLNPSASIPPDTSNALTKQYSCTNCKEYFPLLKAFIMHLENTHFKYSVEDGSCKYQCEICNTEFGSPLDLGTHALAHVSGKESGSDSDAKKTAQSKEIQKETPKVGPNEDKDHHLGKRPRRSMNKPSTVTIPSALVRRRGRPPKVAKISNQETEITHQKSTDASISNDNTVQKRDSISLVRPRETESEVTMRTVEHQQTNVSQQTDQELGNRSADQNDTGTVIGQDRRSTDVAEKEKEQSRQTKRITERKKRNMENQCVICLQKFPSKDALREHRLTHGDKDKWVCGDCNRDFSSHWKFQEHCNKSHNNKKPFQCDECGKCLSSFTILATHKGLHSGSRPYACDICGKKYLVAAGLKDHMNAHRNERNHQCNSCGARFNARGDLTKHLVTHYFEKPHNCPVCDAGFNRAASLKRHLRSHTGEKPFKCDICEKSFSRKEKLVEHRRTHTGERPLICPTCNKAFKDSSNFSNHKKIHRIGYVPRRRKRQATMKKDAGQHEKITPRNHDSSVEESVDQTPTLTNGVLTTQNPVQLPSVGEDSALKDFATISMATESLQTTGQEIFRQIFGAAMDANELRNLANVQNVTSSSGALYNLSAIDLRSLQLIINGAQARNPGNSAEPLTGKTDNQTK